jgi:hypothetical protein
VPITFSCLELRRVVERGGGEGTGLCIMLSKFLCFEKGKGETGLCIVPSIFSCLKLCRVLKRGGE